MMELFKYINLLTRLAPPHDANRPERVVAQMANNDSHMRG